MRFEGFGGWVARAGISVRRSAERCVGLLFVAVAVGVMGKLSTVGGAEDVGESDPEKVVPELRLVAELGGRARAVALKGGYAYVAVGHRVLILRAVAGVNPTVVSEVGPFESPVLDVAAAGDFVCAANDFGGLRLISVEDPGCPREVGLWRLTGEDGYPHILYCKKVAASEGYAYVLDQRCTTHVVDVRDRGRPKKCAEFWGGVGLTLEGNRVYVAGLSAGLRIVDVERPEEPRELGSVSLPGLALGVSVSGGLAFVAAQREGLRVVDVSDPTRPREVGSVDTPGWATAVDVLGEYAYVADARKGLRVLAISDPRSPVEVGYWDTIGTAWDVAAQADVVYVADDVGGLCAVDVRKPARPEGRIVGDRPRWARGVAMGGNWLYVADARGGLVVAEISEPCAPVVCGFAQTEAGAAGVYASDDFAYVASLEDGLTVVDVSKKTRPVVVGRCDTEGTALEVGVSGSWAYVADGWGGLAVIDISDPTSPRAARVYYKGQWVSRVAVHGTMGCVVLMLEAEARLVDFGTRDDLRELASIPAVIDARLGLVSGKLCCACVSIGGGTGGSIRIYDVSDGGNPVLLWEEMEPNLFLDPDPHPRWVYPSSLQLSDGQLYVAGGFGDFRVYEIRDPRNPRLTGAFRSSLIVSEDDAVGIAASSGCAYIALGRQGLRVVAPVRE